MSYRVRSSTVTGFQQINAKNIWWNLTGPMVGRLPAGELVLTTKGPKQIQLVDGKDI